MKTYIFPSLLVLLLSVASTVRADQVTLRCRFQYPELKVDREFETKLDTLGGCSRVNLSEKTDLNLCIYRDNFIDVVVNGSTLLSAPARLSQKKFVVQSYSDGKLNLSLGCYTHRR